MSCGRFRQLGTGSLVPWGGDGSPVLADIRSKQCCQDTHCGYVLRHLRASWRLLSSTAIAETQGMHTLGTESSRNAQLPDTNAFGIGQSPVGLWSNGSQSQCSTLPGNGEGLSRHPMRHPYTECKMVFSLDWSRLPNIARLRHFQYRWAAPHTNGGPPL